MKINEVLIEAGKVHKVPKNTFTPSKAPPQADREPDERGYDWRNPNHNPSGKKPAVEGPHKYEGAYKPSNYPVIDDEFDTRLFDPELVAVMKDEYKREWNKMTELQQIECQLDWIAPPPRKDVDYATERRKIEKYAIALQKKIKRD